MNARAIKKRLMRGRVRSFWGRRAFITVRLPLSVIPVELPPEPHPRDDPEVADPELWESDMFGGWRRDLDASGRPVDILDYDGDVTIESWSFASVSCGEDPRERLEIADRHVCESHGIFRWVEGKHVRGHRLAGGPYEITRRRRLSDDLVDAHIAWADAQRRYLEGVLGETGSDVLDAFHAAATWARTTYPEVCDGFLYIAYSVKWFYADQKYRFCADLSRAIRLARANGVDVRVTSG